MAQVYQRKDRDKAWYIEFRWEGRRYREYAGPAEMKKSDAEQFLAKRKVEVAQQRIHGPEPEAPVSFAVFADDFLKTDSPTKKSKSRDKGIVEMLKVQWKGLNLDQITPKMVADYKALRLVKASRAPATVNKELQVIKRLFKKAVEWGKVRVSPALTVKKETVRNNRIRFLEADELKRLFSHLDDGIRRVALFARFTGARRGEILDLTWADVDMKRKTLTYRDTKNGETATVPMNETVAGLLKALPSPIDRTQRVFQMENTPATWMQIRRAWADACDKAKITDFHFHDLRHQAATDLRHLGVDLGDVKEFLRHKSMTMTLRYAHIRDEKKRAAAQALDALATLDDLGTKAATGTGEER